MEPSTWFTWKPSNVTLHSLSSKRGIVTKLLALESDICTHKPKLGFTILPWLQPDISTI